MKNTNTFYTVVLLAIIVGVVWYVFNLNKPALQPTGQTENNQVNQTVPEAAKMPKFVLGSVSSVEGKQVFIKVGTEEKTVVTNENTEIIKQVKDGDGYKNTPANFNEVKSPVQIVVYYSESSGVNYTATKIQILNF